MEYLSWLFFCLSPFALFCSENGGGLILCPVFIILGFIFRYADIHSGSTPTEVVKVDQQEFWEWHYRDRMRSTLAQKDSIGNCQISAKDKEARDWATTMCSYHNCCVPSEGKQEQIARANGVVTEKMIKERNKKKDGIQIGKYFLMRELKFKYEREWRMRKEIESDMLKIEISNCKGADDWWVKRKYNMTVSEMWETLPSEEKQQAEKWVKEYEAKLIKAVQDYENYTELMVHSVKMDF